MAELNNPILRFGEIEYRLSAGGRSARKRPDSRAQLCLLWVLQGGRGERQTTTDYGGGWQGGTGQLPASLLFRLQSPRLALPRIASGQPVCSLYSTAACSASSSVLISVPDNSNNSNNSRSYSSI